MDEQRIVKFQQYLHNLGEQKLYEARGAVDMDEKLICDCYGRAYKLCAKWLLEIINEG